MIATPSIWNAVEIAIRGRTARSPTRARVSGSSPSNATESSPASSSSMSSRCSRCDLLSLSRFARARARPARRARRRRAGAEVGERLAVARERRASRHEALDRGVELLRGTRRKSGRRDRGVRAERRRARRCRRPAAGRRRVVAHGRALEAEVADPVLGARVRAAVEVEAEVRDLVAEALLEVLDQPAEPRLRLGDREVAVRLAGASDRAAADAVRRRAGSRSPSARATTSSTRSSGTFVTMKFCWRVMRMSPPTCSARSATRDHLVARDRARGARARRRTRGRVLLLRVHAEVVGRLHVHRRQRRSPRACGRAAPRPARAFPQGRCRRS